MFRYNNKFIIRFMNAFREFTIHKWKAVLALLVLIGIFLLWYSKVYHYLIPSTFPSANHLYKIMDIFFLILSFLCVLGMMTSLGTPYGSKQFQEGFERIGFRNSKGDVPILLTVFKDRYVKDKSIVYTFFINNIPLSAWEKEQDSLETLFKKQTITTIHYGDNNNCVIVGTIPYGLKPKKLLWKDNFLHEKDSVFVLGQTYFGSTITVDINQEPHILLGGSTGSGKSILLKVLLMQALKKSTYEIVICDMKGGLDYPRIWHEKCTFTYDASEFLSILEKVKVEFDNRITLLRNTECADIDKYYAKTGKKLNRIIIAVDEVAQVLDRAGATKNEKDIITLIENYLSIFAQLSRAVGIHLFIATQRPSADILIGKIKNNIDCRLCGKADSVLSQIIIDSTSAATKIPKDAQGRFLNNKGEVFQAYYWSDEQGFF